MTALVFIWPPRELHPNSRIHWRHRAPITKNMRTYAASVVRQARLEPCEGDIRVKLTFCPPDKRKRDRDGLQANCKAMLDGIADGLGIDDSRFRPVSDIGEVDPAGKGFVLAELEPWSR